MDNIIDEGTVTVNGSQMGKITLKEFKQMLRDELDQGGTLERAKVHLPCGHDIVLTAEGVFAFDEFTPCFVCGVSANTKGRA